MKHRHGIKLIAVLLVMSTAAFAGISVAGASSGPPAITLSPTSGPAGTTMTVTLPAPCTIPSYDAADPSALTVSISSLALGPYYYAPQSYAGTPGVPITSVMFPVPTDASSGHYVISASCNYPSASYGSAYFVVTGGSPLPSLTVSPSSGPVGSVVDVSGACAPSQGQPSAYLYVTIASASDPNLMTSASSGAEPGPTITLPVTLPSTFPPGAYFVTATCNDYVTFSEFAESPLTVTGSTAATTISTTLTNSAGVSGSTVSAGINSGVTDSATLAGSNVASAGGTATYSVYSDSACTNYVATGGTQTVTAGSVPTSNTVSLPTTGTYYWQVTYSGDGINSPSTSTCGAEVEDVNTDLTTSLSGGGQSGVTILVPPGTAVTDTATLSGPGSATANGTIYYAQYEGYCPSGQGASGEAHTVTDGIVPPSNPFTATTAGNWYWQATFVPSDSSSQEATSTCGIEIESYGDPTSLTTSLSGGGQSGPSISVPVGAAVTDSATLSGTDSAGATGSVNYVLYSDSQCLNPVGSVGLPVTVTGGVVPPSSPEFLTTPGTYYWQASYSGDASNLGSTSACGSEVETVTPAGSSPTTVSTSLSGGGQSGTSITVPVGTAVTDAATLGGVHAATASGSVTYNVYYDSACTILEGNEGTFAVTDGNVPASSSVTQTTTGAYYWQASYSGDATNAGSVGPCGSEVEQVGDPTTITTSLSGGGQLGSSISVPEGTAVTDTATLSGAGVSTASGEVVYGLFADSSCQQPVENANSVVTVTDGSVPASTSVTVTDPGTYYWRASYYGDSTNAPSSSTCGSEVETVTAALAPTTLTTSLSASGGGCSSGPKGSSSWGSSSGQCNCEGSGSGSKGSTCEMSSDGQSGTSITVTAGTAVTDQATLSGANEATAGGTVTYTAYSDSNCSRNPVDAGTVVVTDGVVPASNAITLNTTGTYYWQASYSGDSTNAPSKSPMGSEVETVVPAKSPCDGSENLVPTAAQGIAVPEAFRQLLWA